MFELFLLHQLLIKAAFVLNKDVMRCPALGTFVDKEKGFAVSG